MDNKDMPAMPQACVDKDYWKDYMEGILGGARCGLTKREHFAGLAMQGLCANPDYYGADPVRLASYAIERADALLSALEAKQ